MVVHQGNELQMHGILPLTAATDADTGYVHTPYVDKRKAGPLAVDVAGGCLRNVIV